MADSTDAEIIEKAMNDNLVIVTLDSDFHTILAAKGNVKPSVIRIRIEGIKAKSFAKIIQDVLQSANNEIKAGAAISVNDGGIIRVHKLPLV